MTVTATEAPPTRSAKPHVREKQSLGVKNLFLGNTKKKR
jgi:hypothetical protein